MGPETLDQVLNSVRSIFSGSQFSNLLVGIEASDDAAVYKINKNLAIIHTVDFFTPIVDNPYDYGSIAAANALNDIYAMGGEVILALNICAFPENLPIGILKEILRGGAEKVAESGGVLAGGHTINDKEPKYGLSVIGTVHPNKIFLVSKAQPGDSIILTKPLGVGVITTALKGGKVNREQLETAVDSMKKLNRHAGQVLKKDGMIHCCTDITGFSLLGHSIEIVEKSKVKIVFQFDKIPFLDGSKKYALESLFPGGCNRNRNFYTKNITFSNSISQEMQKLLFTPETSGGLLACVPNHYLDTCLNLFRQKNQSCWVIGKVEEGTGIEVI
jgi:selenide,water dikinase